MQEIPSQLATSNRNIKVQMGQTVESMSKREPGTLPTNTVVNPKETSKAITLKCGKAYDPPKIPKLENEGCSKELITEDSTTVQEIFDENKEQVSSEKGRQKVSVNATAGGKNKQEAWEPKWKRVVRERKEKLKPQKL